MAFLDDVWNTFQSAVGTQTANDVKQAISGQIAGQLEKSFDYVEIRSGIAPPIRFTGKDLASIGAKKIKDAMPPPPAPPTPPGQKAPPPPAPRSAPSVTIASIAKPTILVKGAIFGGERAYYTDAGIAGPEDYKRFWWTAGMLTVAALGMAFLGGVQYERRRKKT